MRSCRRGNREARSGVMPGWRHGHGGRIPHLNLNPWTMRKKKRGK
jgi:hypothetical protein